MNSPKFSSRSYGSKSKRGKYSGTSLVRRMAASSIQQRARGAYYWYLYCTVVVHSPDPCTYCTVHMIPEHNIQQTDMMMPACISGLYLGTVPFLLGGYGLYGRQPSQRTSTSPWPANNMSSVSYKHTRTPCSSLFCIDIYDSYRTVQNRW
jgi:hypothetical protein